MAVPIFEDFLYPFLCQIKDNNQSKKEITDALIKHFNLSAEDCAILTRNGSTTRLKDRIGWTLQYLRRAKFVDIPQRGVYQITQRGKDYLQNHKSLCIKDLLEYPEFQTFSRPTSTPTPPTEVIEKHLKDELTPTEMLEQAYHSIVDDLAADLLAKVMEQSPEFFEHLVVDLLVKMGYGGSFADSAKVTSFGHDDGIDGIIYEDKLGLDKIYIQAKRWTNPVGRPVIQQFAGALVGQNATKGVFITTSQYSKEARQYVSGLHQKIVLIDGEDLARYMIEYNVGVSTKLVYEVKRIDSDYFED